MPRMGNANFKREKIRSEREILDRLFPNWGVYHSNKPCSVKSRNIDPKVIESESDRDSLGGCTSSDESTGTMSHRRLDHPPSENESGSNSDSAMDPGSSSDSEKTSDEQLNSLSETISRISISSVDSAIDDKVSQNYFLYKFEEKCTRPFALPFAENLNYEDDHQRRITSLIASFLFYQE